MFILQLTSQASQRINSKLCKLISYFRREIKLKSHTIVPYGFHAENDAANV